MTQTRTFAHADLTQIVSCCQQERGVFHRAHDRAAPAWVALQPSFEPPMRAWIGSQQAVEDVAADVCTRHLLIDDGQIVGRDLVVGYD